MSTCDPSADESGKVWDLGVLVTTGIGSFVNWYSENLGFGAASCYYFEAQVYTMYLHGPLGISS